MFIYARWFQSGREVSSPIPPSPRILHGPAITETVGSLFEEGAKFTAIVRGMQYRIQYATRLGVLPDRMQMLVRYDIDSAHVFAIASNVGGAAPAVRDTLWRIGNAFRRSSINRETGAVASNFTLVVDGTE